ncbi:MAG: hypothetical protein ACD_68C00040G0001, partial [uncultured bacterium]
MRGLISKNKNELITAEKMNSGKLDFLEKVAGQVYVAYQKLLVKNQALDFDDLLMLTVKIWEKFPAVLKKYQDQFQYVLVDEYQDTNHAQYSLLMLLAKKHRNLCVVGDDAQSIYGFRGADIRNILNFEKDFPECKVVKLEQNYRSSKNILAVANQVILANKSQKPKELWTENPAGRRAKVLIGRDEYDEGRQIIRILRSLHGTIRLKRLSEAVILYRTNAQSRPLEEMLLKNSIPYQLVGG